MKRNDFVTNVLKCNNFHCLASLRLVDLNVCVVKKYQKVMKSSLPEASGFKYVKRLTKILLMKVSSLPEASGFKSLPLFI